ncbi:hypothetical protein [Desulfosediminicola sp.]|uniref:hypothetical protein n=1 Tax=Desulfosediminicola sp. TaxID=2886825 RepID=UPI003AF2F50D
MPKAGKSSEHKRQHNEGTEEVLDKYNLFNRDKLSSVLSGCGGQDDLMAVASARKAARSK